MTIEADGSQELALEGAGFFRALCRNLVIKIVPEDSSRVAAMLPVENRRFLDEGDRALSPGRHAGPGHAGEGIHIELVVGEDHEVLEVLRIGAGVMGQTEQRIVHARPSKR